MHRNHLVPAKAASKRQIPGLESRPIIVLTTKPDDGPVVAGNEKTFLLRKPVGRFEKQT